MASANPFAQALHLNEPGNLTLQLLAEAGYLWSYRGQPQKAAEVFQALCVLAPNDPIPYLGLSEVCLSQSKYREAERNAEQAIKSSNLDRRTMAFAYKLRGKALLQQNKYKEAEKLWQRAAELDKDGPEGAASEELLKLARHLGIFEAQKQQ